jgi:hypothetical protein
MLASLADPFIALLSSEPFGALGVLAGFAAALMPRRTPILLASALCSALFCAHFLRLGSATGAAMCLISLAQSLAATQASYGSRPAWLNGFFAASSAATVGLTLATWAGWSSALAGTGALFATAARLQIDAQRMRWLLLACTLCWIGHNTLVGSISGLTGDTLTLVGLSVGLWRGRDARERRLAPA